VSARDDERRERIATAALQGLLSAGALTHAAIAQHGVTVVTGAINCADALIAELDERAEQAPPSAVPSADALAAAEARGYARCQADVVAWLRITPSAGDILLAIASSQDIARCANAIDAGEHHGAAERAAKDGAP
jgi:hypothetical protein